MKIVFILLAVVAFLFVLYIAFLVGRIRGFESCYKQIESGTINLNRQQRRRLNKKLRKQAGSFAEKTASK